VKTTSSLVLAKRGPLAAPLLGACYALFLGGCAAVEGIFKAGLWVGIVAVVALVAVVGGVAALLRR
jgi:hypothetical protein